MTCSAKIILIPVRRGPSRVKDFMPSPPVIVVYGHDQSLLDTRTWVLQGAGYQVSQASQLSEVEQAADQRSVALVVMCHTLSGAECEETRTHLDHRPEIHRLLITANQRLSVPAMGEPVISAFDGPRALVDMVEKILSANDRRGS